MSLYPSWRGLQIYTVKSIIPKTSPWYGPILEHETPFQSGGHLSAFFCPQKSPDGAQPLVAQCTQARDLESRIHVPLTIQVIQQISWGLCKPWHLGRTLGGAGGAVFPPSSLLEHGKALPVESTLCGVQVTCAWGVDFPWGTTMSCGMLVNGDTMWQGT